MVTMEHPSIAVSSQANKNITNLISFIICPYCKKDIPGLSLRLSYKKICINLTCNCFEGERQCTLEDFITITDYLPSDCAEHLGKKTEYFCVECSFWLCKECMSFHNEYASTHPVIEYELTTICKAHDDQKYSSYCLSCKKNICSQCKSEHKTHNIIPIKEVTFPPLKTQTKNIKQENQQIINEFNAKIESEIISVYETEESKGFRLFKGNSMTKEEKGEVIEKYKKMKIDFLLMIEVNEAINDEQVRIYNSIVQTIEKLREYPMYQLMRLCEGVQLNKEFNVFKTQIKDKSNIDLYYGELKNYFKNNHLLLQSNPSNQCKVVLAEHNKYVKCLAQINNGRLASAFSDATLKLCNLRDNKCISNLLANQGEVSSLLGLKANQLAASANHIIYIWNVNTLERITTLEGHTKEILCLAELNNNRLASGSSDCTIMIWSLEFKQAIITLTGHSKCVYSVIQLFDGRLASSSEDSIKLWDLGRGECERTLAGHKGKIFCILQLNDRRLVSGGEDNLIKIWNLKGKEGKVKLTGHTSPVKHMIVLYNERLVSCSVDKTIMIWDIDLLKCVCVLKGHLESVNYLLQLEDGRLASASNDGTIRLWDI